MSRNTESVQVRDEFRSSYDQGRGGNPMNKAYMEGMGGTGAPPHGGKRSRPWQEPDARPAQRRPPPPQPRRSSRENRQSSDELRHISGDEQHAHGEMQSAEGDAGANVAMLSEGAGRVAPPPPPPPPPE